MQQLDRCLPFEPAVRPLCTPDATAATLPERRHQHPGTQSQPRERSGKRLGAERLRRCGRGRRAGQEVLIACPRAGRQHRRDSVGKIRIYGVQLFQPRGLLFSRQLKQFVEFGADPLPVLSVVIAHVRGSHSCGRTREHATGPQTTATQAFAPPYPLSDLDRLPHTRIRDGVHTRESQRVVPAPSLS